MNVKQSDKAKIIINWLLLSFQIVIFLIANTYLFQMIHNTGQYNPDNRTMFFLICASIFIFITCNLTIKSIRNFYLYKYSNEETIKHPLVNIYNRRYLDRRLFQQYEASINKKLAVENPRVEFNGAKTLAERIREATYIN